MTRLRNPYQLKKQRERTRARILLTTATGTAAGARTAQGLRAAAVPLGAVEHTGVSAATVSRSTSEKNDAPARNRGAVETTTA